MRQDDVRHPDVVLEQLPVAVVRVGVGDEVKDDVEVAGDRRGDIARVGQVRLDDRDAVGRAGASLLERPSATGRSRRGRGGPRRGNFPTSPAPPVTRTHASAKFIRPAQRGKMNDIRVGGADASPRQSPRRDASSAAATSAMGIRKPGVLASVGGSASGSSAGRRQRKS